MAVMNKLRFMRRDVFEERPDGRQPCVAAADAVAAHRLDEAQESTNEVCVKVLELQVRRRAAKLIGSVVQQQAEGIPIARDRMGARPQAYREMVGEEPLKANGKQITVHDASSVSAAISARAHARRISSGTASMYQ